MPYYPFRNNIADHIVNKRRPALKIEKAKKKSNNKINTKPSCLVPNVRRCFEGNKLFSFRFTWPGLCLVSCLGNADRFIPAFPVQRLFPSLP